MNAKRKKVYHWFVFFFLNPFKKTVDLLRTENIQLKYGLASIRRYANPTPREFATHF